MQETLTPLRSLVYRPTPEFLKRKLWEEMQIQQAEPLDPNQYSQFLAPSVQKVNTILQDLKRREENARIEAQRAQELLQKNIEAGFSATEQARDARREALRQASQEQQLQNRMRLRAMGALPSSAIAELNARTERELMRSFGNIDNDYTNKLAEIESEGFKQFSSIENSLRKQLADIETARTMALRELEAAKTQEALRQATLARENEMRAMLLGSMMQPQQDQALTSQAVLGEQDNRVAEVVQPEGVDFITDLKKRAKDVLGIPGGYNQQIKEFPTLGAFNLWANLSSKSDAEKRKVALNQVRLLAERHQLTPMEAQRLYDIFAGRGKNDAYTFMSPDEIARRIKLVSRGGSIEKDTYYPLINRTLATPVPLPGLLALNEAGGLLASRLINNINNQNNQVSNNR